ncbi:putative mediator of RNA polymerase II transcription subunit 26 [Diorhabda carinulata]|uniref:putative mediator of RNA polymerase II transcription subunit 26 n=1 Tax=Diorhabda carinulata TaxID=1163345 RepID=UPI0025A2884E|nr:putative mediator of RNA polymerase II transcription subunit 26 [Diorhabda carinulata]
MLNGMQPSLVVLTLIFAYSHTVKPPGYAEPQKTDADPNPPKYEYGYNIIGDKGEKQGKQEQRDGIYASGRYFVQNKDARQDVQYFADDWGYHPAVEYGNVGPHSKSNAKFALGHEAVIQLRNKENNLPQLEGLPDTGPLKKEGTNIQSIKTQPPNSQFTLLESNSRQTNYDPIKQQQQIVLQQSDQIIQEKQQIINEQPQQIVQEQQQIINEQPRQIVQEQQQIINEYPQQIVQEQQQIINEYPQQIVQEQQQIINEQPQQIVQEQQQIINEYPQQIVQEQQQVINRQPQQIVQEQQRKIVQELPQQIIREQQQIIHQQPQQIVQQIIEDQQQVSYVYNQQPIAYSQPQQVIVQHIQQPIENVIFPQSTPSSVGEIKAIHQEDERLRESDERTNTYQQFGVRYQSKEPNKLITNTQNLINGQDVLDINNAVSSTATEDFSFKSTTPCSAFKDLTRSNFEEQPIVAAEIENNLVSTTESIFNEKEQFVSTIGSTNSDIYTTFESTTPTPTVVVTPRPNPVTTRLESTKNDEENYQINKQNVQVEIQKTIPYYLGKYDSSSGYISIKNELELGKTLLYLPGQLQSSTAKPEVDNDVNIQKLPNPTVDNRFVELDQHQVVFQQQSGLLNQPYPIRVPVPVVKQVTVPVHVEKVVEKPIHITKIVEKPVAVPQPYPVEKIVEKPVHVPVQITKYIDRPYPVAVRVPYPQPYPVEVRVPVHIDRIIEKKVPVPHYIEKQVPVEKIVEKKVPQYVDRPYPVHIQVPVPTPVAVPVDRIIEKKIPVPHYIEKQVPVEKIVEKPVPQYIDRPYPVPQPYYIRIEVPRRYQMVKYIQKPYANWPLRNEWNYQVKTNLEQFQRNINTEVQTRYLNKEKTVEESNSDGYHYPNPYTYAPKFYLPPKPDLVLNKGYLPPLSHSCDHGEGKDNHNYVGLSPPKADEGVSRKYRSARSNFNDKNIKMEYGFMPPLVPSLEIDEYGQPVEKDEK